jgi:hypothetical protein
MMELYIWLLKKQTLTGRASNIGFLFASRLNVWMTYPCSSILTISGGLHLEGFPIDLCMINQYTIVITNDIGNKLVFLKIVGDKILHEKDAQITPVSYRLLKLQYL